LEDWLSSITRLGFAGVESDGAESGAVSAVLDHLAGQVEVLQTLIAQSEENRAATDEGLAQLTEAINKLARIAVDEKGQHATLLRIAEGQERLVAALTGDDSKAQVDAESRMRLRSIDVQLLRILEELAAGRQEAMADLRADLSTLTNTVRQLTRGRV
ncbi:MAG: biopolymer transporter ExbB, partial [Rhodobacteraceae bacterium]|nr:biopolymer transporter ExbB [Paracoccaceae bacterium]